MMRLTVSLPVMGVVRTAHTELETTPIQAALNRAERGRIDIAEAYQEGLEGLEGFDYAWLLTWLHNPVKVAVLGSGQPVTVVPVRISAPALAAASAS